MDKQRRRELKKLGSAQVKQQSEELRERINERNPFPVGHPNWVANLRSEYYLNREFRQNSTMVLRANEVLAFADIKTLGFVYGQDDRLSPRPGVYLQCVRCSDLVPTNCVHALRCSCESVVVDPVDRSYQADPSAHTVVELVGKGQIKPNAPAKPWWKFWE
jgi:hypothetical protein